MLGPDHVEESVLVVHGSDDRLVGPDLPASDSGVLAQSHPHGTSVLDNNLVNGTRSANHCTMVYSTPMNGMEIAV